MAAAFKAWAQAPNRVRVKQAVEVNQVIIYFNFIQYTCNIKKIMLFL